MAGTALLVGDATVEPTTVTIAAEKISYRKFTALATGVVNTIEMYVVKAPVSEIEVGIWADSSGAPGALLGHVKISALLTENAWLAFTGLSVEVTSGTVYWLGFVNETLSVEIKSLTGTVKNTRKGSAAKKTLTGSPAVEAAATPEKVSFKALGTEVTPIPLSAAASESAASGTLTARTAAPLGVAASTSAAEAALAAKTGLPLIAANSTSAASASLTATTQVPLAVAASTSSATAALTGATQVALAVASSTSAAEASFTAKTQIPLSAATSTSTAPEMELTALSLPEVVYSAQGTSTTVTIPAAAAGDQMIHFILQQGAAKDTPPKAKDNISGETGWVVQATKVAVGTERSLWVAIKTAVGGETKLEPVAGSTAIQGYLYYEVANMGEVGIDALTAKEGSGEVKTLTSAATTTHNARDIILAAVGLDGLSGTITAWTGTGPLKNVETTNTKVIGGSLAPNATESAVTFTANWTTARHAGMLVLALLPAVQLNPASSESSASAAVSAKTQIPLATSSSSSSATAAVTSATTVALSPASSTSAGVASLAAKTQIPLESGSSTSSSANLTFVGKAGPVEVPLAAAASTSTATAALTAATQIALATASSTSAGTAAVKAATRIPLESASSTSNAPNLPYLLVHVKVPLQAASSLSAATFSLSATTTIPLAAGSSTSSGVITITTGGKVLPSLGHPKYRPDLKSEWDAFDASAEWKPWFESHFDTLLAYIHAWVTEVTTRTVLKYRDYWTSYLGGTNGTESGEASTAAKRQQYVQDVEADIGGTLATIQTLSPTHANCLSGCVSPDGKFAYVICEETGEGILQYSRDTTTGLLTPLSVPYINAGVHPWAIAISPDGKFAYICYEAASVVRTRSRNPATGLLGAVVHETGAGVVEQVRSMVFTADGKYLYVPNNLLGAEAHVTAFKVNTATGELTFIAEYPTGELSTDVCMSPDEKFVYVANNKGKSISQFSRNTSTGALTALSPRDISVGVGGILGVACSPDGKHLYAALTGGEGVGAFSRNESTGVLTKIEKYAPVAGFWGLCLSVDGLTVYLSDFGGGAIWQYRRDPATGLLAPRSPAKLTLSEGVSRPFVSPDGENLYVGAYHNPSKVWAFDTAASIPRDFDGPFMDDINWSGSNKPLAATQSNETYRTELANLVEEMRLAIGLGQPLHINPQYAHIWPFIKEKQAAVMRMLENPGSVDKEFGVGPNASWPAGADGENKNKLKAYFEYVDFLHEHGIQIELTGSGFVSQAEFEYHLAVYFLGQARAFNLKGRVALNGDFLQMSKQYPLAGVTRAQWEAKTSPVAAANTWWSGLDVDIGEPLEGRKHSEPKGVYTAGRLWSRRYAGALVYALDPAAEAVTITLPPGTWRNIKGEVQPAKITLSPRTESGVQVGTGIVLLGEEAGGAPVLIPLSSASSTSSAVASVKAGHIEVPLSVAVSTSSSPTMALAGGGCEWNGFVWGAGHWCEPVTGQLVPLAPGASTSSTAVLALSAGHPTQVKLQTASSHSSAAELTFLPHGVALPLLPALSVSSATNLVLHVPAVPLPARLYTVAGHQRGNVAQGGTTSTRRASGGSGPILTGR